MTNILNLSITIFVITINSYKKAALLHTIENDRLFIPYHQSLVLLGFTVYFFDRLLDKIIDSYFDNYFKKPK